MSRAASSMRGCARRWDDEPQQHHRRDEQGRATGDQAIDSVPVLLALVVLQFFILGSVMYLSIQRDKHSHARLMLVIERCTVPGLKQGAAQLEPSLLTQHALGGSPP